MARISCSNPFSFTPMVVTLITAIVYLSLIIPLLIIHENVPAAPSNPTLYNGLNTTEAWLDLTVLTNGYHPYNSRRSDVVRDWLLRRIESILDENGIAWTTKTESCDGAAQASQFSSGISDTEVSVSTEKEFDEMQKRTSPPKVTIFNDLQSNVTFSALGNLGSKDVGRRPGRSVYFEGTNIIVYIRGTDDEEADWWKAEDFNIIQAPKIGGVLVNAHYDSVSTGFGATDDGMGVITILQLIRFFTTPGNEPKKGIVAMLNNGEEDFLNGVRAYTQHPISRFAYTFLNLEGAGAGGRATLFRSTDLEVTAAYATNPNPFGTIASADGFKAGFVRSQTDYVVLEDVLGLRGLDVAFWYPRARYHTDQDDAKHTSVDSLWHMLQTAMYTVKALSSGDSDQFTGPRGDGAKGKVKNGGGTDGVWFDMFGKGFALFGLRGLFAWSLTLLVASPLALILIAFFLHRQDKLYIFAFKGPHEDDELAPISLHGWRGVLRFPLAFITASALTVGSAFLVRKFSKHLLLRRVLRLAGCLLLIGLTFTRWSMMLSLYFISFWWVMKAADFIRPSALHRGFAFIWMYLMGWAFLVAATVLEDRFQIATGYLFVFFESVVFLATAITLCELFALPTKSDYAQYVRDESEAREALPYSNASNPNVLVAPEPDEEEATESTPLFGGDGTVSRRATTFANYARRAVRGDLDGNIDVEDDKHRPYGDEQPWSTKLPSWSWLLQFLIVAPILITLIGQVALLVVDGISQTGPDGSSLLLPYVLVAFFSIMLLLPLGPFAHRILYHVPSFLFLVFIGTLIYNLVAFPFSANNRYKAYFVQTVDLETGQNQVALYGLEEFIRPIIASIPSASGQSIECITQEDVRTGVKRCSWEGLAPRVVPNMPSGVPPEKGYAEWLTYNVSRNTGQNSARFVLSGQNTRACVLRFDRPIKNFEVLGSGKDDRFDAVPEAGSDEIRLWHREWDQAWTVDVEWGVADGKQPGDEGMEGKVVCLWSDDNVEGVIPALDEIRRFSPTWTAISKAQDGLVEGSKGFVV